MDTNIINATECTSIIKSSRRINIPTHVMRYIVNFKTLYFGYLKNGFFLTGNSNDPNLSINNKSHSFIGEHNFLNGFKSANGFNKSVQIDVKSLINKNCQIVKFTYNILAKRLEIIGI